MKRFIEQISDIAVIDKQPSMEGNIRRIGINDCYVSQGSVNRLRKQQGIDLNTLYDMINGLTA